MISFNGAKTERNGAFPSLIFNPCCQIGWSSLCVTLVSPPQCRVLARFGAKRLCPRRREPVVVFMCVSGVAGEAEGDQQSFSAAGHQEREADHETPVRPIPAGEADPVQSLHHPSHSKYPEPSTPPPPLCIDCRNVQTPAGS